MHNLDGTQLSLWIAISPSITILPSIAVALDCKFVATKSCHCRHHRLPKLCCVNIRGGWQEGRLLALWAKLCRRRSQFCRRQKSPPLSSQAAKIAPADPYDRKRRMARRSSFGSLDKTAVITQSGHNQTGAMSVADGNLWNVWGRG